MKQFITVAPPLAIAILLQGCLTREDDWHNAEAGIAACFKAMDEDPGLAQVNAKYARRDPTPSQLSDRAIPSDAESAALRRRVEVTGPCRTLRLAAVRDNHPLLEPAYTALYYQADQVFSYLQQQSISYGMANRLSGQALASFRSREHEYFESSDAQRAVQAEALELQLQAAHSSPPPEPGMQCRWEGLNVSCH